MAENEDPEAPGQSDLAARVNQCMREAKRHSHDWRVEARENYDFAASRQWSDEDISKLEEQGRPAIVFNRTRRTINAVCGLEVQNRQEVRYLPREEGDIGVDEVLTSASRWVRENCDAEDEESSSFEDLIISGMGWTETRPDYEENPEGNLVVDRTDPLDMFWDASSRKKNLLDAAWVARVKRMTPKAIKSMWPDYELAEHGEQWLDDKDQPHDADPPFYDGKSGETKQKEKEVVQYQWYEKETYYKVVDVNGQMSEFNAEQWAKVGEMAESQGLPFVKMKKKVFYQAFVCGGTVLEEMQLKEGEFTFKCMTGMRDRNANTWQGLVSLMKDPQRWANKWLSQIMHILNSNAKGGLLAEKDAFTNPKKAEEEWADPTSITLLNPGGLAKVKEKAMAQFPVGFDRLLQFAVESINDVPGVNSELLGLADRQQAGVLEETRKQAGVTILAVFFDALRRYRKEQGRLLAKMIREYIADGRLIRVVGKDLEKWVPLVKDQMTLEYDIVVDDAPTSPNMKERVFGALTQLLPVLMEAGIPIPPEVLDYSPLPSSLTTKWKEMIPKPDPNAPPPPDPAIIKIQADQQAQQQKLQADSAAKDKDMQLEAMKARQNFQLEQWKAQQDAQLEKFKAELQAQTQIVIEEMRQKTAVKQSAMTANAANKDEMATEEFSDEGQAVAKPGLVDLVAAVNQNMAAIIQGQAALAQTQQASNEQLAAVLSRPKQVIRGPDGRVAGVQ